MYLPFLFRINFLPLLVKELFSYLPTLKLTCESSLLLPCQEKKKNKKFKSSILLAHHCRDLAKQWRLLSKASNESARNFFFFMKTIIFQDTEDALIAA